MAPASEPTGQQAEPLPGRRTFFSWLTYGLGAVAAGLVGIPFVGYLFGVRRAPVEWVRLGPVADFPQNETRTVTFDNPIRQPWDGMVAYTGVHVRHEDGVSLAVQLAQDRDGLRITAVVEGSSAAEAGLQVGDVLTKLNGNPLPDEAALAAVLEGRQPGEVVVLTRRRQGRESEQKVRLDPRFLVLAVNCAHLGCPVEWFAESGLFMCPCHGGVYYANGEHASGPPPRGLYQCVQRVTRVRGLDVLEIQAPHFPTLHNTLRHPA
jgi:Rieske Fe-S protein